MIAYLLVILIISNITIVGPAVLSEAHPGVLERTAHLRMEHGFGLRRQNLASYDALVAPPQCELLGYDGWLVVDGKVFKILIVDCGGPDNTMIENGLLADINKPELVHKRGWMVLRHDGVD